MLKTTILVGLLFLALVLPQRAFATISFSISNPQSSNDQITIDVSISGLSSSSCPDNTCYLQAAFTSQSQTRYFGFTENNSSEWYKYDGSPGQDNIKSTFFSFHPQDGSWSGTLKVKADPEDTDYEGPGTYDLKAWRYSGNSDSSSGDSDSTLAVELTIALPSPSPSPQESNPSPTTSTSTKSPSPTPKNSPKPSTKSPSPTPKSSTQPKESPQVLGKNDIADSISALGSDQFLNSPSPNPSLYQSAISSNLAIVFIGVGAVLIGLSFGMYLWYKKSSEGPGINKEKDRFEENKEE